MKKREIAKVNVPDLERINHFIKFKFLLGMLKNKEINLTDQESWDDKNDTEVLEKYRRHRKHEKLYALCCLFDDETIHHWSRYTEKEIGCCVQFDAQKFISHIKAVPGIRQEPVSYRTLEEIRENGVKRDDYPFTKRWPYRCEAEYRLIWSGKNRGKMFPIGINLNLIKRITLLTRNHDKATDKKYKNAKADIQKVLAMHDLKGHKIVINRSTVYKNHDWINLFEEPV